MPVLNKQHAIVHTAAIDVKIMRLDGKQVTLSVFRQLQEESIFHIDENNFEARLKGIPWGFVNYQWEKNLPKWAAFNLVWQLGEELRRCPIPDFSRLLEVVRINEWTTYLCPKCGDTNKGRDRRLDGSCAKCESEEWRKWCHRNYVGTYKDLVPKYDTTDHRREILYMEDPISYEFGFWNSYDFYLSNPGDEEVAKFIENISNCFDSIVALEQLFIAV